MFGKCFRFGYLVNDGRVENLGSLIQESQSGIS